MRQGSLRILQSSVPVGSQVNYCRQILPTADWYCRLDLTRSVPDTGQVEISHKASLRGVGLAEPANEFICLPGFHNRYSAPSEAGAGHPGADDTRKLSSLVDECVELAAGNLVIIA